MTDEQLLIKFDDFPTVHANRQDRAMIKKHLLVDFENVQQVELSRLDESFQVTIFVGASQRSIPVELVTEAQKLGDRVAWTRLDSNGKNALDFFIAFELGRIAERNSKRECLILSRDKGFDPLIRHLNKNGLRCRRINEISEIDAKLAPPVDDAKFHRVVEILGKLSKRTRPRKRKTLAQSINAMFPNKIKPPEVEQIVEALFKKGMVTETDNSLAYKF